MMSDETTTEQLAEIEGQPTEFTPPEGWRLLEVGETLTLGDEIVQSDDGRRYPTERVGSIVGANQRYIRRIERPQPEPQATEFTPPDGWQSVPLGEVLNEIYIRPIEIEPEPEPQPIQVREGRWRKRSGAEVSVSAMPTDHDHFLAAFPWWDGQESTWTCTGHLLSGGECPADLVTYLGSIEEAKTQELPAKTQELPAKTQELPADTADELRSEVSYVQNLLGESRQRVTHLEELVASLRNINVTQEKAFTAAGKENTALRNQLAAVKAELANVAADRQQLRVELDAAQQVPADSPELRQLRADLAEVTWERDRYLGCYQRIFGDLETIRETTKAAAVEAIAEWLEPVRLVDNPNLANETLQHLPQIMRHLTRLDSPEDVD